MDIREIPQGHYCYTAVSFNGPKGQLVTKTCPHWQKTKCGARCNLLNISSEDYSTDNLLWDQVKECEINLSDPFDEELG